MVVLAAAPEGLAAPALVRVVVAALPVWEAAVAVAAALAVVVVVAAAAVVVVAVAAEGGN